VPIWLQEGFAKYFESSWRGTPGLDLLPATRALLGVRIRANKLVTFAQMHPSMAMLPAAEDAETAFAEVYFAVDFIFKERGAKALREIVLAMAQGKSDQAAVGAAMGGISFSQFEKRWLAYLHKQPFPKELIPRTDTRPKLKDGKGKEEKVDKGREISFSDFAEVEEPKARERAHLGELFRERDRNGAAAEAYGQAHALVGDKYESISNKYALSLLAVGRLETAVKVLKGSLTMHPGAAETHVHLARIHLAQGDFQAAKVAYLAALGEDPFDPEILVGLLAVGRKLGEATLAERGMSGATTLLGLSPKRLEAIADRMAGAQKDLSQAPTLSGGADAGTPPAR
jgi:tetratricopeptide (TPR) repeat protein